MELRAKTDHTHSLEEEIVGLIQAWTSGSFSSEKFDPGAARRGRESIPGEDQGPTWDGKKKEGK